MSDLSSSTNESTMESFKSSVTKQNFNGSEFVQGCRVVDRQFQYLPWNNPDNIISLTTQVNSYKAGGVLLPVVGLLGMPLNIINCIAFWKLGLRERVNLLLFSLGCADFVVTFYNFSFFVEYIYMLIMDTFKVDSEVMRVATNIGITAIPLGASFISGFISTLIACERCLCITHPFQAKKILRARTTAVILLVSAGIIFGFHYIISAKYKIGCQYIPVLKASITVYYASEFYKSNKQFVDILNVMVFGLFLPPLFVLTTGVTTTVTVVRLKSVAQWRQHTATVSMESKEIAVTKMLIAVSILFIVCSVPNVVMKIIPLVLEEFRIGGRNQNILMMWIVVVLIFNAINSSLNFFFYFKMGSRFRKTLTGFCGQATTK